MPPPEKFSVLLVDDDPTVIRILSRILGDYAPLRFATSGRVALRLALESPPDLVMLDVEMPEMSGFEICRAFKGDARLAGVPIVFMSSHESTELETAGLRLGAADFIRKPPHASLVLARVRTYQQLKSLSDTVRSAVTMDFLTGACSRRQLEKTLTQEWLRAQRSRTPLSLLVADLDGFTAFNSQFGEEAGDACLRSLADALRTAAQRPADLLARHGGGSFALLLPATNREGAAIVAHRALCAARSLGVALTIGGAFHEPSAAPASAALADGTAGAVGGQPGDLMSAAELAVADARRRGGRTASIVDIGDSGDLQGPARASQG